MNGGLLSILALALLPAAGNFGGGLFLVISGGLG